MQTDIIEPDTGDDTGTFTSLEPCRDPNHYAPGHIMIPAGHKLTHTSPNCFRRQVVHGRRVVTGTTSEGAV